MTSHVPSSTTEQGHQAAGVVPGQILLGKYRIERVLGMGGMGVVVAATHVSLEERVAIKFLLPAALTNGEAVARFLREARAAVRIKSEHVARVTDVGQLETGAPYMIMEYLDGADLGTVAQRRGAFPLEDAVEFVLQACEALAEAHALGIVHRDLKPANLFLVTRADGTPSVKVLDFGISKMSGLGGSDLSMTKTNTVMGSPLYMSPEQMASTRDVDARTDIWALGAILYELMTGTVPFQADTITQLCAMILQQQPPALRNSRPDAPLGLEQVILRCLEKDRTRRFSTVADFAQALSPYAPRRARLSIERVTRVIESAGLGGSQQSLNDVLPPSSHMGTATGAAWGASGVSKRGNGLAVGVVAGVVLLAGAAIAGVLLMRGHDASKLGAASAAAATTAEPAPATPAVAAPTVAPIPAVSAVTAAPVPAPSDTVLPAATPAPKPIAATAATAKLVKRPGEKPASKAASGAATSPAATLPPPAAAKAAKKADLYDDRK